MTVRRLLIMAFSSLYAVTAALTAITPFTHLSITTGDLGFTFVASVSSALLIYSMRVGKPSSTVAMAIAFGLMAIMGVIGLLTSALEALISLNTTPLYEMLLRLDTIVGLASIVPFVCIGITLLKTSA